MAALTKAQAERLVALKAGQGHDSAERIAKRTGKYRTGKQAGENYSTEAVGKVLDMARAIHNGTRLYFLRVEAPLVRAVIQALEDWNK